jgi:hypothetical protein
MALAVTARPLPLSASSCSEAPLLGAALLLSLIVTNILEWKEIFEFNEW